MQYDLNIPEKNQQPHVDIENDIKKKQNGLFTFVLRVHDGRITDYNLLETIDARTKYLSLKQITWTKQMVSRYPGERNQTKPIRATNV